MHVYVYSYNVKQVSIYSTYYYFSVLSAHQQHEPNISNRWPPRVGLPWFWRRLADRFEPWRLSYAYQTTLHGYLQHTQKQQRALYNEHISFFFQTAVRFSYFRSSYSRRWRSHTISPSYYNLQAHDVHAWTRQQSCMGEMSKTRPASNRITSRHR